MMTRLLPFLLCAWFLLPLPASAEEPENAEHEPICAKASKAWSEALLSRLGKQIEAHGLPVGEKPK